MNCKSLSVALATTLLTLFSQPAAAQIAGVWHVTGDISSHDFVLDCHFEPAASQFGGTCIEAGGNDGHVKPGKVHKLSQGSVSGLQVRWAYPVTVMLMSFDIRFSGMLSGNAIVGDVTASGRKGKFTAVRK